MTSERFLPPSPPCSTFSSIPCWSTCSPSPWPLILKLKKKKEGTWKEERRHEKNIFSHILPFISLVYSFHGISRNTGKDLPPSPPCCPLSSSPGWFGCSPSPWPFKENNEEKSMIESRNIYFVQQMNWPIKERWTERASKWLNECLYACMSELIYDWVTEWINQ